MKKKVQFLGKRLALSKPTEMQGAFSAGQLNAGLEADTNLGVIEHIGNECGDTFAVGDKVYYSLDKTERVSVGNKSLILVPLDSVFAVLR